MLGEVLRLMPSLAPNLGIAYEHYEDALTPQAFQRRLDERHADATCVVGVNLHIEVRQDLSQALAEWCGRRGIPIYDNVQDYWPHHRDDLRRLAERFGVELLASSPFIVSQLIQVGFTTGHLPMGAQLPSLQSSVPSLPPAVGAVGRMVRRKRFPDVVKAFRLAGLDKIAQLHLTLVPSQVFQPQQDSVQMELLRAKITGDGFDAGSIKFIRGPVVPPGYDALTVYVCASDYEGFSMTPYEAAYCGCPPIVSDIPPHRHMAECLFAERAEEFLFPVGDCLVLAAKLTDEIVGGARRAFLKERSEEIRHAVEDRFSIRVTARALAELALKLPRSGRACPSN
jgi:glycosyltransferase involved in cell wall biosynthesis